MTSIPVTAAADTTTSAPAGAPALELRGITKRFGAVVANDSVDFAVGKGEVHVLLGENGAGKSTLMNVVYGHLQPDAGAILVGGTARRFHSPSDALAAGIGMVHQHFSLVPSFSVAQNVVLGAEGRPGVLNTRAIERSVQDVADRLGWSFDVRKMTGDLAVSGQQRVEILKLLYRGATVLLLDEPTALLAPPEIDSLLETVETLRARGDAIVLVTHKLREVASAADRVTVIRHGRTGDVFVRGEFDEASLARAMTGRDGDLTPRSSPGIPVPAATPAKFSVSGLTVAGDTGTPAVDDVTFSVRPGEIVAIAGVEGNGQHELVEALSGLTSSSGSITLGGVDVSGGHPKAMREAGLGIVPADRRAWGVIGAMSIADNLALSSIALGRSSRSGFLGRSGIRSTARTLVEKYDIRPADIDALAGSLSGGNMQKLVVARELHAKPSALLAASPTWGLDVGAVSDVHSRIREARDEGCAVLLQSLDLDEVLALADRILVMYRGRIVLEVDRADVDLEKLSLAMIGG
ncbi:ABC transporter ATP-binding protein [Glaciihabitans sp. dw_435]|uniref:ABC transporter ATP-binding protein n=1 Tax=Glaciihabitans sp. dw_435 TaxID=2720081 RepID=UPI001BD2A955|nr:ABC transporter ATP-binding protein [Glaciihabitans sp. dw_435]